MNVVRVEKWPLMSDESYCGHYSPRESITGTTKHESNHCWIYNSLVRTSFALHTTVKLHL